MKVTIILGTDVKGCTYEMKELLKHQLSHVHQDVVYTEFSLPSASPHFCAGCKNCFIKGEWTCPHAASIQPIWSALKECDLLVFIYPQYVMRVPGQLKALLDHFGVYWASHRPEPILREKKALIITQGIGAPTGGAIKDACNCLRWMGVSDIRSLGLRLIEGVDWSTLPDRRKQIIEKKLTNLAKKTLRPLRRNHPLTLFWFKMCRQMQRDLVKRGAPFSLDTQYWIDRGLLQK